MRKSRIAVLLLMLLIAVSCTPAIDDNTSWLRGKGFAGPATVTTMPHNEVEELQQIVIKFDPTGKYELYKMEAKGELKHTYTSSTCKIEGIVVTSEGTEFMLDIEIKKLPKRKIEYHEKMTSVSRPEAIRTVIGTLNEVM